MEYNFIVIGFKNVSILSVRENINQYILLCTAEVKAGTFFFKNKLAISSNTEVVCVMTTNSVLRYKT